MKTLSDPSFYAILALLGAVCTTSAFLLGSREGRDSQTPVILTCNDAVLQELAVPVSLLAQGKLPPPRTQGRFVGSKNGTKYYTPGCPGAKRIKPENYVWFLNADDAILQGYTPGSC